MASSLKPIERSQIKSIVESRLRLDLHSLILPSFLRQIVINSILAVQFSWQVLLLGYYIFYH
ncbi:hypothetical protein IQ269_08575 [Tychonema sp. LEGE 07199]|uniref:hypothetical protein n=1 Tax=Microcoleaceae TaxID=1892252 RepID=UPI00188153F0|nr:MULTISPECIES: hypothetical protein [unclassified Tychonema]MBE9120871.1 hypothetical protein [Tychonema sp. LEGE 07199]MBE9134020.1 hypothetical protein [Tychonema sp. LEGE 07196]MBE9163855.1 hypothetical protein [Tychonema sp. LEGE 06208]